MCDSRVCVVVCACVCVVVFVVVVQLPDDGPLLAFLDKHGSDPLYDQKYALRLCTQEHKKRACVAIYSTMGLYEEAVDHALSVDLTLAMRNADLAVDDDDLRKKLWLRIAKHVVTEEKNIDKCVSLYVCLYV